MHALCVQDEADFDFDGEGEDDQPPSLGKRSGNKQPSGPEGSKTSSKKHKTDKKAASSRAPENHTCHSTRRRGPPVPFWDAGAQISHRESEREGERASSV